MAAIGKVGPRTITRPWVNRWRAGGFTHLGANQLPARIDPSNKIRVEADNLAVLVEKTHRLLILDRCDCTGRCKSLENVEPFLMRVDRGIGAATIVIGNLQVVAWDTIGLGPTIMGNVSAALANLSCGISNRARIIPYPARAL